MKPCFAFASLVAATIFVAPLCASRVLANEVNAGYQNLDMEMIDIAPATYQAGDENGFWDMKPAHAVTISRAYRIAARPLSNAQYEAFDPTHRTTRQVLAGDDDPVSFVTWQQAMDYCVWLSAQTDKNYRLPSEAEWEYAFKSLSSQGLMV